MTKSRTDATSAGDTHAKRWWILAVLGIAQLMVVLDATVVNIALPTAQTDLAFSDSSRQWIVTAYSLAFGSLLLIGGRIADIVGRTRIFIIGMIGFAIASAVGGAAVNVGMLIAARAVQGVFAALLAPAILALLTTTFTEARERNKAFGIFGAIAGSGASIGLLLGGVLTEYANWRWTLFVNLIFAVIGVVGGLSLLQNEVSEHRPKLDVPGTILVSAGLFALVYGFSHAETDSWSSLITIGFLAAAGILLIAFVVTQMQVRHPLLPLRIVTDRNRGGAFLAMVLSAMGMFAVFLFLTYYLQASLKYSAVMSGVAFLPMTGVLVVVAGVGSTVLIPRVSPRILIPLGMLLGALSMYLLTNIGVDTAYVSHVLPALLVLGAGLGLVFAPAFSLATLGVNRDDAGVASAAVNTVQQVGGAVGTALLNTIAASALTSYFTSHPPASRTPAAVQAARAEALVHSYVVPFWWATAIFAFGAVVSALVLRSGVPDIDHENAAVVA
ncbi:MFS transporter [Jatrophihabitans endophyticus]